MSAHRRSALDGGVVLITGASSGIGAAFAELLAPRAARLVLVARREARLVALAESLMGKYPNLKVHVEAVDLADPVAGRALIERVEAAPGGLDVLINNAGMGDIGLFASSDPHKLENMLAVNVVGLTALTRAALPGMLARKRGAILFVSSGFGLTWMPFFSAYVGTKHYVTALAESLRAEIAGQGVSIVQLCPGPVATEFEAVAGNPTGQKVPGFIELSASEAAAAGIGAIDHDRALVVPGFWAELAILAGRVSPRAVLRLFYGLLSRFVRPRLFPDPR